MQLLARKPAGVTVTGVGLSSLTTADVAGIRKLLAAHGFAVFPDQRLTDGEFVAFLRGFGPLTFSQGEAPLPGFPDLNVVTNVGRDRPPRSVFHVDTSYVHDPPAYTALRAVQLPEQGGETLFSNQYRAYQTLPPEVRDLLAGRSITHVVTGLSLSADGERVAEHPALCRHPISGRVALYLSTPQRCVAVSGLPDTESRELIDFLYAHSTRPDNVARHSWSAGDVVMWDNRCVMHRADHTAVKGQRTLHRGMVTEL